MGLDRGRRRVCARCYTACERRARRTRPRTREEYAAAYAGVSARDLVVDAVHARTVADIDLVGLLALLVVTYPTSRRRPVIAPDGAELEPLDVHIDRHRRRVVAAAMTPEERAAAVAQRADEARRDQAIQARAARERRIDRIRQRQLTGSYLMPWERDLVS